MAPKTHNTRYVSEMGLELQRLRAKAAGRARTIRRQERQQAAARAWVRGEFARTEMGDPMDGRPFACIWCGDILQQGGREAAQEHVAKCGKNPLAQRIADLERQLAKAKASHGLLLELVRGGHCDAVAKCIELATQPDRDLQA